MKRSIVLTLMLLCAFSAQALGPLDFGLRGGVIFSQVDMGGARSGDYYLRADADLGYYAGLAVRLNLPKSFSIQPEINYKFNSYTLYATPMIGAGSYSTVKINAIEFPILVGKKVSIFRFQAGPVFNLYNNSTISDSEITSGGSGPKHGMTMSVASVGYTAGVSVGLGPVSVSGRYNGQFKKTVQTITIGNNAPVNVDTRMSGWMLSVGFNL